MTTMAEAEWDQTTRDLALAHDQAALCPVCGGPIEDCQNPGNADAFEALPPVRCHRYTALREAQRGVTEQTNPVPEALIWQTVLKGGGERRG